MITDRNTLFYRYWNALIEGEGSATLLPYAAVRLALRLAIDDAIALSAPAQTFDQRVNEHLEAQISRLNDWLQVHEPGLYISPGDTADAVLAALGNRDQRIAELLDDLEQLQVAANAECAELQEDLTSARNELVLLIAERDNGAGLDPMTAPAWTRNHPAWEGMTDEQRIAVFELHTDRVKFGELPLPMRTEILACVLRHTMDGTKRLTMAQFDNRKPEWMPISSGLVKIFGGRWSKMLELADPTISA